MQCNIFMYSLLRRNVVCFRNQTALDAYTEMYTKRTFFFSSVTGLCENV